jgi:hypothetical protein
MYMLRIYYTYTDQNILIFRLKFFDMQCICCVYTIHILTNLFCQGHDSAPGLYVKLPKQQHLSVSGKPANPARQHPPVEYVFPRSKSEGLTTSSADASCVPSAVKPASSPAGACFSVGRRSIPTLQLRSPVPQPKWASGKFKSMSGPVTSWQEPGARLDPRPTSDASQQVPCDASVGFRAYIPCINHIYHHGMHAGSVVVYRAGCYA